MNFKEIFSRPWSRVTDAVGKLARKEIAAPDDLTMPLLVSGINEDLGSLYAAYSEGRGRTKLAKESWEMYDGSPDYEAQVDGICEDAMVLTPRGYPFEVNVEPIEAFGSTLDDATAEEMSALGKRCMGLLLKDGIEMQELSSEFLRWALLEGDSFGCVVVDWGKKEIDEVYRVSGLNEGSSVTPIYDGRTLLGYEERSVMGDKTLAFYADWQLVQFSWKQRKRMGRPLSTSACALQARLTDTEKSLALAREERGYLRIARIFDPKTPEKILLEMIRNEKAKTRKAGSAARDIWTTLGVQVIDPSNTALGNIADIEYIKRQVLTAGRKPKGLLAGYGEGVNRAVLDRMMESYSRFLERCCSMLGRGIVEILRLQFILWGLDPAKYRLTVKWGEKSVEIASERRAGLVAMKMASIISARQAATAGGYDGDKMQAEIAEESAANQGFYADLLASVREPEPEE